MNGRDSPRLLVLGGTGLVGAAVVRAGTQAGLRVAAASRSAGASNLRVDLGDPRSVRRLISESRPGPDVVILAAAVSNVAECEREPEATSRVNVAGSGAVVEAAVDAGARVAFISSDYVFGEGGPHHEGDLPAPMNEYGRQKLQVETLVLATAGGLVIRTCQVYGSDPRRANYVLSVIDRLSAGRLVEASPSHFGTPTYAEDLGEEVVDLVTREASDVWHVAGPDNVSRLELALRVAAAFDLEQRLVRPSGVSDAVPRPTRAGLISRRGRLPLRALDAGLADMALEVHA